MKKRDIERTLRTNRLELQEPKYSERKGRLPNKRGKKLRKLNRLREKENGRKKQRQSRNLDLRKSRELRQERSKVKKKRILQKEGTYLLSRRKEI